MKYPFLEYHRVAVLSSLTDTAAPTVAELNLGTDVTCDLTDDGLRISRPTESITRPRWSSDVTGEVPTRHGVRVELGGYRFTPPDDEPLWDACATFRAAVFLVVRRGVPYATAWTAAQSVEVITGRWGKRATDDSGAGMVTFSVPMFVTSDNDAATVAA